MTTSLFVAICLVMLIEMGQSNPVIGKKYGKYALFIRFICFCLIVLLFVLQYGIRHYSFLLVRL